MVRTGEREHMLHERLRAAYDRQLVSFYTNPRQLQAPSSPVFSPWIAGGPLLVLLLAAVLVMFLGGLIAGTVTMVLAVIIYVVFIRPWVEATFRERAIDMALRSEKALQKLWDYGGIGIALTDRPSTLVAGPKGHWKAFLHRHLPDIETEILDEEIVNSYNPEDVPDRRAGAGTKAIDFKPAGTEPEKDPRGPLTGEIFDGPLPDWDLPARNEERFR